eukprot:CAMPEP_0179876248 /NCGR_PEP_ID=MMETSP0982-20121206/24094_1 /TAXON_ID=483367 /ORGANISM="non described non described, Strain CCMP 2436" /LENGTH=201 /DNA_ID=CAMNT_0021768645 /DNA_START=295 /DNA_END=901 /DNA_ORIENTATION=-
MMRRPTEKFVACGRGRTTVHDAPVAAQAVAKSDDGDSLVALRVQPNVPRLPPALPPAPVDQRVARLLKLGLGVRAPRRGRARARESAEAAVVVEQPLGCEQARGHGRLERRRGERARGRGRLELSRVEAEQAELPRAAPAANSRLLASWRTTRPIAVILSAALLQRFGLADRRFAVGVLRLENHFYKTSSRKEMDVNGRIG